MSVMVRDHSGQIWLFCKGAEATVLPLVSSGQKTKTMQCIHEFAMRGLRTLLVACRRVAVEEYRSAVLSVRAARLARCSITDAATRPTRPSQPRGPCAVSSACQAVERDLTLLGATAVEDRLQPGVREALATLREAGIKTWILTGDKVETAISISYASRHFDLESELLFLTEHTSAAAVGRTLRVLRDRLASGDPDSYGLVVDGESLALALQHSPSLLVEVGMACPAVVCCRLSPLQKCQVVRLVKNSRLRPTTAAVGDGANDVAMIQEAHVGLGLIGKEGRQAERCADFAVARFRFLQRALLVHGHWYYYRLATLVHYFFYKNVVFVLPQFYFILFSFFSPQSMYTSVFLTCFNIIFTSAPVLVYGLLEQNSPSYQLLQYPPLYKRHQRNRLMKADHFFMWLASGCSFNFNKVLQHPSHGLCLM